MEEKAAMEKSGSTMMTKLPDQQFAAHFVDSNPAHSAMLAQVPSTITLNFNFTLSDASTITVTKDGAQVNSGTPTLSPNRLTMTTALSSIAGNGTYIVDYKACWPDNSCHNGKFAFTVSS
jgi:methionine-rich copper-binding protein CopC